jgi:hypothetical protein
MAFRSHGIPGEGKSEPVSSYMDAFPRPWQAHSEPGEAEVECPHHAADVKKALPSLCWALHSAASNLPKTDSRSNTDQVVYQSKDTRTQTFVEARRKPEDLVAMLSVHVLERYQHSMRYFGLLAPRTKAQPSMLCFLSWARRNDKDPQGRVGSNHCRSDSELIRSWIPLDNVCTGPDIALLAPMPMDRSQVLRRIYCE